MILHRIDYNGGDIWVDKDTRIPNNYKGWCWQPHWCKPVMVEPSDGYNLEVAYAQEDQREFGGGIIKAQSTNLSLPNIPYVEIEEDVEQLAIKASNKIVISKNGQPDKTLVSHWLNGYKAASAKKWTDEDLRKAFEAGAELDEFSEPAAGDMRPKWKDFYEYLESLQPKVVSIEVEMIQKGCCWNNPANCICEHKGENMLNNGFNGKLYDPTPVTYTKDGKTFIKVKKVNHESK